MAVVGNGTTSKALAVSAAVPNPPCTFAGWWKPDVTNAQMGLVAICNGGDNNPFMRLMMSNTGKAMTEFRNNAGGVSQAIGSTTCTTAAFQHLLGIIDVVGSDYVTTIYFNGTLEATGAAVPTSGAVTVTNTSLLNTERLTVGNFADGALARPAIWNFAAGASMRADLAAGFSPTCFSSGLVMYQPVITSIDETGFVGPSMTPTDLTFAADPTIDDACGVSGASDTYDIAVRIGGVRYGGNRFGGIRIR